MPASNRNISFIGFGEAAQAFTQGFQHDELAVALTAYDIKTDGPNGDDKRAECAACDVTVAPTNAEACTSSGMIFSLVTADKAETAAMTSAENDLTGRFFFDCNSCAPETKRRSAARIEAAGGRYVDVAVMTPVNPKLHKSPCLLSGPHAQVAHDALQDLGMSTTVSGLDVGDASTRKMIRSIMVKGLEALTIETFLAARKAGIEDDILATLDAGYPGFGWPTRGPYMLERALTHGTRRAAEMREVVLTLSDLGLDAHMTRATVERQAEAGALGLVASDIGADDLAALTGAMLKAMNDADQT